MTQQPVDVTGNNAYFQNSNIGLMTTSRLALWIPTPAPFGTTVSSLYSGNTLPAATLGQNGDYYFRNDTPGTASQRLYVKSAGAWVGIV